MRIVVYQDYLRVGGTESQSLYLATQFQEKGDEVCLLTNRPGGRLGALALQQGLRVQTLQPRDLHLNWPAPGLRRTLRALRPDVLLLMGRNANGRGFSLQRALPETLVVSTFRTGRRLTLAYRRSLRAARLICCNSDFAASRLRALGIPPDCVEVHPNACTRAPEIDAMGGRHQRPEPPAARLIYVAAFVPGKNHESLIRFLPTLLTLLPELKLTLVGEGPLMGNIQGLVEELGLQQQVTFEGYRRDVPELLAAADLVISPSLEESMPNALVEAQYAGLPVVAYDVAGVRECFVPEHSGILIPAGDIRALGDACVALLSDPQRWRSMAAAAHAFGHAHFEPNLRFDAFYDCVLKYRGRS